MPTLKDNAETFAVPSKFEIIHNDNEDENLSAVSLLRNFAFRKNKRIAPRYVRDDIVVALCEISLLSFGKEIFLGFVRLNDITSRGLSFYSMQQISVNKKIVLNLKFHTETTFKITATIIYRIHHSPYQYGVRFDFDQQDLGDHLLETQRTLVFK
jgi:hypothetical protein